MKYLASFTLFLLIFLHSDDSHANQCTITNYSSQYVGEPIPIGSDKTGETLGTINVSFNYDCTFSDAHTIILFATWGQKSYLSSNTYASNLDGIQLVTPYSVGTSGPHTNSVKFATLNSSTSGFVSGPMFHVKKVDNVSVSGSSYFLGTSHIDHNLQYDVFRTNSSYGVNVQAQVGFADVPITRPTCTLNSNSVHQVVALPTAALSDFSGIGSTIAISEFFIKMNCGAKVSLSAYMTDANSPANVSNALTLNDSSTAAGVGIQVLANNNENPVIYGVNKWYIAGSESAEAMNYTIPFLAKYVQTEPTITPGSVNAQAVISFFYE